MLATTGYTELAMTHLAGDSLFMTSGDNMNGWRHLACVIRLRPIYIVNSLLVLTVVVFNVLYLVLTRAFTVL